MGNQNPRNLHVFGLLGGIRWLLLFTGLNIAANIRTLWLLLMQYVSLVWLPFYSFQTGTIWAVSEIAVEDFAVAKSFPGYSCWLQEHNHPPYKHTHIQIKKPHLFQLKQLSLRAFWDDHPTGSWPTGLEKAHPREKVRAKLRPVFPSPFQAPSLWDSVLARPQLFWGAIS